MTHDKQPLFSLHAGTRPVLISIPHDGGWIPADIADRLMPAFRQTPDRDWHVSKLYDWAQAAGFSLIRSHVSRYVIDLNRPPDNTPLYPGAATPGLCPVRDFNGQSLYRPRQKPDAKEVAQRLENYWRPYHQALESELMRLKHHHGRVLLWDAHSIHSKLPALFSGRLPNFNLGTNHGASCAAPLQHQVERMLRQSRPRTVAVNGRFVGGYITRHYGQPRNSIHAMQMEIGQRAYLNENTHKPHHGLNDTRQLLRRLLLRLARVLEQH